MSPNTGQPTGAAGNDGTIVRTPRGALAGQPSTAGVTVFRGIRYAEAPVGDLRWKPPVPAAPWADVRAAIEFGAACRQVGTLPGSIYALDLRRVSEDCLFLNVWRPPGAANAPVMVWIHGGSLRIGEGGGWL